MQYAHTYLVMFSAMTFCVASAVSAGETTGGTSGQGQTKQMSATTAQEIKPTVSEAITHAKKAVDAGQQGDSKALVSHAEKALEKAKQAQAAGLNEYLNEGTYALGEAIEHGRKQETKDATEHMRHAIMRLSQAAGLQMPN